MYNYKILSFKFDIHTSYVLKYTTHKNYVLNLRE